MANAATDTTYSWQVSGDHTIAPKGASSLVLTLPQKYMVDNAPTRRSVYTEGAQPRCPNNPAGLAAFTKDPNRRPSPNGCGSADTGWLVPDFSYGPACDNHDNCYGKPNKLAFIM